jgi:response regulator of citrate/malate metabolism
LRREKQEIIEILQIISTSAKLLKKHINMTAETINVLLIDDDASYVGITQHSLKQLSGKTFNLVWKDNGTKAIEELKNNQSIHIILMDYYLPEKNGLEIVKEIKELNISIPIIFLTSNKDFKIAIEAMKYNVEDYLIKDETTGTVLPRTILTLLEKNKIKKQIQQMEKEKILSEKQADAIRELIVTICHEFNNPLAAIKISTDIISKQNIPENIKEIIVQLNTKLSKIEKEITTLRDLDVSDFTQRSL